MYFCSWPIASTFCFQPYVLDPCLVEMLTFASSPEEASENFSENFCAYSEEAFNNIVKTLQCKKQKTQEGIITYGLIDCYKVFSGRVVEKFKIWTILDSPEKFNDFGSLKANLIYTEKGV